MKPIGRILFEAADGSAYYPLPWNGTLALALLPGGACTVRLDGQAYAFQGATGAPTYANAPVLAVADAGPALAALKASVDALPQAADINAPLGALKIAIGAVLTAVLKLPDPTAALAAIQAAVAKQQAAAGVATSIDVIVPDSGGTGAIDVGQVIYIPNPAAPANAPSPTFTVNGKAAAVGSTASSITA